MLNNIIPNKAKALFLAKKQLPEFVCNVVNLEGINYTLPEIQTLLDGITIGGHKLSDQVITSNQIQAFEFLFQSIENNSFSLNKSFAIKLHAIAAKEESLEWGKFRAGMVTISGTDYLPPKADLLDELWGEMVEKVLKIGDIYKRAISLFLQMARIQFFYDANKRMGRFMMNGMLLSYGYPAINLPAKRQLEFNSLMLDFYKSNDMEPMIHFMLSCLEGKIIDIMNEQ